MSHSDTYAATVRHTLWELPIKAACCRKAFLYGLLLRAEPETTVGNYALLLTLPVSREDVPMVCDTVASLLHRQFGCAVTIMGETRASHRYLRIRFSSRQVAEVLACLRDAQADDAASENAVDGDMLVEEAVGFSCPACATHFLRGAFLCAGSVSDPKRAHHLEFRLPDDGRAVCLADVCAACGAEPGITHRGGQCGIFFKRIEAICDLLTQFGSVQQVFEILNNQLIDEQRAETARTNNWVAANIERTVQAGQRQRNAIRRLTEEKRLKSLPPELQETARLRMEYPEASLAELASLHEPPITKSGLNHRLQKITEAGEENS